MDLAQLERDRTRFLAKCRRDGACLVWCGAKQDMHKWRQNPVRYAGARANWRGHFKLNGRREYAHRAAWKLWMGDIPAGLVVRHAPSCRSTLCVWVGHLSLGTPADNAADREARRNAVDPVPF